VHERLALKLVGFAQSQSLTYWKIILRIELCNLHESYSQWLYSNFLKRPVAQSRL